MLTFKYSIQKYKDWSTFEQMVIQKPNCLRAIAGSE